MRTVPAPKVEAKAISPPCGTMRSITTAGAPIVHDLLIAAPAEQARDRAQGPRDGGGVRTARHR